MSAKYNKVSDSFVCPYCLSESKLNKIQFRSKNQKHDEKVLDHKKTEFWSGVSNNKVWFHDRICVAPRIRNLGLHTVNNKAKKKVPVAYVDENKYVTDQRVCPICHNDLPENIGFVNTANILILGDDSAKSFKYIKMMFESLLNVCFLDNMTFYVPDEKIWRQLSSLKPETSIKHFAGKAVIYSPEQQKTLLEITITYYPLGVKEMEDIDKNQMSRFLLNSNGIIFVSDYANLFDEEDDDDEADLELYLTQIRNIIGLGANNIDSLPVAFVFSNEEELKNKGINTGVEHGGIIESESIVNILQTVNNRILQNILACFPNNKFFSAKNNPNLIEKTAYQDSLQWIFDHNGFSKL